ncbi:hypothetical protein SESBI_11109 [Sesbania bispinosa]|nr:hypothetical protein SESBI_11109 [Sesbania bispinosa]
MDGHSSTSQVRVLSSSSSNPNYDWILPEVLEKPSEYLSVQSINKFREEYDIGTGNLRVESSIIAEPCLPEEFVCFKKKKVEDPDFTFGKMASKRQMSAKDLRSFYNLGQKRDKLASTSQNSQSQGPTNSTLTGTPPPSSPKRQRLEGTSDNTTIPVITTHPGSEMARPPSVERIPEKWWLFFREFKSAEDMEVTSIFDHHFQMTDIIEGNLCKAADGARIQKVGLCNTAAMAQSMATRTTFLAHGLVEDGQVTTLSEEVETQKIKIKELETANQSLTKEKTEMSSTISLLRDEKEKVQSSFDAAKAAWQLEEKELKTDLAIYHGNGFNKAIE